MNKVAVITRTKDRPILLRRAIESVLDQTFEDWVHVIVNDGGDKENVERTLLQFRSRYEKRVILIHNPTSVGMEGASNIGIRASESEYVVIHDDDDTWCKDFLYEMISWLEKDRLLYPTVRGVACHSTVVIENISDDAIVELSRHSFNSWLNSITLWRMLAANYLPPISFLFERSAALNAGLFDATLPVLGDWDFHIKFLLKYDISLLPAHLAFYHHRKQDLGTYTNTVTARDNKHELTRSRYVNEKLRQEISSGQLGLATLINIAYNFDSLHGEGNGRSGLLSDNRPLLQRIRKRTTQMRVLLIILFGLQIVTIGSVLFH